jgi:hypothetical protein
MSDETKGAYLLKIAGVVTKEESRADRRSRERNRPVNATRGLDEHERRENEVSVEHGFRLLSAYTLQNGTEIWIITEADLDATILLVPSEY